MESSKKILVFGYINTNVIDGSAIFMSSLCKVLSIDKSNDIDLLLSVPYNRDVVLGTLEQNKNVNIIDPYDMFDFQKYDFFGNERMNHEEAAKLINEMDMKYNYDYIFIRSLDISNALLKLNKSIIFKTFNYLTGITSSKEKLTKEQKILLSSVVEKGGSFLCQTNEMKNHILENMDLEESKIISLKPMIPDVSLSFSELFIKKKEYNRFIYTGKFAHEWNTVPMIVQFREVFDNYKLAHLDISGDQFKRSINHPEFVENASYLLRNTYNLTWHGALNREETMELIKQSDIGITWRNEALNHSLELSTKLLEYSSMGKPAIMNPTKMHKEIFGNDYPFYADTDEEFYNVMKLIIENPKKVEEWSEKVFDISRQFSFTETYLRLAPHLAKDKEELEYFSVINKLTDENLIVKEKGYLVLKFKPENIINLISEKETLNKIENYKILNDIIVLKINDSIGSELEDRRPLRIIAVLLNKYYKLNSKKHGKLQNSKTLKNISDNSKDDNRIHHDSEIKLLEQKEKKMSKQLILANKRLEHQKNYSERLTEQRDKYKKRMLFLEEKTKKLNDTLNNRK